MLAMSHYDIYGIGNALVDSEYRVEDAELQAMNVEKGAMTLIDEERRAELLSQLGELPGHRASGGSAANTMIAAAQMGSRCFYSCKVADDELGQFYLKDLKECDVDSNKNHSPSGAGATGTCLVLITPDAERSMSTYLGATSDLSKEELDLSALERSKFLYIEGYLAASPTGRQAIAVARETAKAKGVKIAMTLSDVNMIRFCREGIDEMLGDGVDLLFANEEEARLMFDTEDLDQAMAKCKEVAQAFVITCGKDGAYTWDGQELTKIDAVAVQALDTNGAGDMFAGAVLHGLTHEMNLEQAAALACRCSGELVKHFGPRLPMDVTRQVLAAFQASA